MKKAVFVVVCGLLFSAVGSYTPGEWNLAARQQFAAHRFGVFIHWGLYANYAQGEWYLQQGKLDEKAYSRMMYGFCPSKFDAKEWVRVFKGAGAKYVTITSRHHDGFSMWPTKVDDGYNIGLTPFKRDILGELSKACDEAGLQLNFYYSLMDWHRKDYPAGSVAKVVLGEQKGDYASYKAFMLGQIAELIDNYHPGNIWFDGEWEHASCKDGKWTRTLDWDFDAIYDLIHSKKTLVANNNHQPIREKEDIQLFERDLPGENGTGFSKDQTVAQDRPIEQCDVIQENVWGYRIGEKKFRTPEEVCAMICRSAAKDSNLLMNIGPDGSGQLPAKAVEVMVEVGKWMSTNGEAIYGTRGGGIVKNVDGSETAKTNRDGEEFIITIRPGEYPTVKSSRIVKFTYATWNIGHYAWGRDARSTVRPEDAERRAVDYNAFLDKIGADFVGVCEYSEDFTTNGSQKASAAVFGRYPDSSVGPSCYYQWNAQFWKGFKMLERKTVDYVERDQKVYYQAVRLEIGEQDVWIVQTHLDWRTFMKGFEHYRERQMQKLIDDFRDVPRVVISGDFNVGDRGAGGVCREKTIPAPEEYDVFVRAGYTLANSDGVPTCPSDEPTQPLDNIIVKGLDIANVRFHPAGDLSDHNAVSCTLTLRR